MPPIVCTCAAARPSTVVNDRIRDLCRANASGWDAESLAEWARLTAEWREAVAREAALAA